MLLLLLLRTTAGGGGALLLLLLLLLAIVRAETTGDGGADMLFFSFADWGLVPGATAGADGMNAVVEQSEDFDGIDFTLLIGDNFYFSGIENVDDPQLQEKFETPFASGPYTAATQYACESGNHDNYGNVSAEIAYTDMSALWIFPDYYYSREFHKGDTDVFLLAIDTWRLVGGDTFVEAYPGVGRSAGRAFLRSRDLVERSLADGMIEQGVHDVLMERFHTVQEEAGAEATVEQLRKQQASAGRGVGSVRDEQCQTADWEQLAWIDAQLAQASASGAYDWLIVMGHYPVFSSTIYEHGDTPTLIDCLYPMLQKYNVDAYISGHDHVMQYIQKTEDETAFLGAGAGAQRRTDYNFNTDYDGLQAWYTGHYAFMQHELSETEMKTSIVISTGPDAGKVADSWTRTSLQTQD